MNEKDKEVLERFNESLSKIKVLKKDQDEWEFVCGYILGMIERLDKEMSKNDSTSSS